jgi:hypothetical protein
MDNDKSIVMRAFNKLFFEFIDDIISVYPENVDMLTARESFATFKKLNPTSIVKVWFSGIYSKYKTQIDAGDIMFFMDKDYSADLTKVKNLQNVLDMIDNVREPIKNMSIQNKEHVTKYIQDLSKLSTAYAALTSVTTATAAI